MPLDDDARRRAAATKRERTKRKIVDALYQLLRRGWGNVTYAEVAKLAGVSEATVYRYFPTKRDMMSEVYAVTLWDTEGVLRSVTPAAIDTLAGQMVTQFEDAWPGSLEHWRRRARQLLDESPRAKEEIATRLLDALLEHEPRTAEDLS